MPGTDTKVTPEKQEPIMASATIHQLVERVAKKSCLAFFVIGSAFNTVFEGAAHREQLLHAH